MSAVGTAMRLWKLVEMYRSGNVQVVAIDRNLHKRLSRTTSMSPSRRRRA